MTSRAQAHRAGYRRLSLSVYKRFFISVVLGLAWAGLSIWIALPWFQDLGRAITVPVAALIIGGIAIVPGYLNIQLISALLLDRPRPLRSDVEFPPLTLLIAAYNEQRHIAQTVAYALEQDYPGGLSVIVADDGSDDDTADIAGAFAELDDRITVLRLDHHGKALALTAALETVTTRVVATIDADTLLMPGALKRLVARLQVSPPDTKAVAGTVLVRNSRSNPLTSAQEWDYFLGIASIKREQALLQGTLVAQGAFSLYDTAAVREAGGWPDQIGEDIVLTWELLARGARTTFEPTAIAFTEAPDRFRRFARQRRRWARGMIEGLRANGFRLLTKHRPYSHSIASNIVFPYLDLTFCLAFPPGIVLALFGNYAIVGPLTLLLIPLNCAIASIMAIKQRNALRAAGLVRRRNAFGFAVYFLFYQLLSSPLSVAGYAQELMHRRRVW